MNKLMIAAFAAVMCAMTAKADFFWSTWFRKDIKDKDVSGCVLGLASEIKSGLGAEVNVCISKADEFKRGAQVAIGYSRVAKLRNGVQAAFWNEADSAALQFGIVCHNRTGFLPWFPFFNFDKKMFGKENQ